MTDFSFLHIEIPTLQLNTEISIKKVWTDEVWNKALADDCSEKFESKKFRCIYDVRVLKYANTAKHLKMRCKVLKKEG